MKIQDLIAQGDTKKALDIAKIQYRGTSQENYVLQLTGQYNAAKNHHSSGIMDNSEFQQTVSRVNYGLLNLAKDYPRPEVATTENFEPVSSLQRTPLMNDLEIFNTVMNTINRHLENLRFNEVDADRIFTLLYDIFKLATFKEAIDEIHKSAFKQLPSPERERWIKNAYLSVKEIEERLRKKVRESVEKKNQTLSLTEVMQKFQNDPCKATWKPFAEALQERFNNDSVFSSVERDLLYKWLNKFINYDDLDFGLDYQGCQDETDFNQFLRTHVH